MRHNPFHAPRMAPYFSTASMKYWLHEGTNRQCPPNQGPSVTR
jgi:hypothetical protein